VASWQPSGPIERPAQRFGGLALILATLVGAVFGFAAGYMARPRALQTAPPPVAAGADPTTPTQGPAGAQSNPAGAQSKPSAKGTERTEAAPPKPSALVAAANVGSLLIRTNPSGARVEVDGQARGETPLALRGLELGTREISVSRSGFATERRRIALTQGRPSRSIDIRLSRAPAARPAPSTPASLGKPAAATGSLTVESRPTGATVTLDGKPIGVTPLTVGDLAPGDYHVTLSLPGHQIFATTVRVAAGERARAAARLSEQEQE
jgi:hypothetical protein